VRPYFVRASGVTFVAGIVILNVLVEVGV